MSRERITTRVEADKKHILELGSALAGDSSLNQFIINAALEKAKELIASQESFNLDNQTANAFFDAMINPTEPNDYLKQAAKDYLSASNGNGEFNFPITRQEKA